MPELGTSGSVGAPGSNPRGDPTTRGVTGEPSELRARAFSQCDIGKYEICLRILDKAKELDPAGEGDPAVVEARGSAVRALHVPSHP
jgi:hypothetical protein